MNKTTENKTLNETVLEATINKKQRKEYQTPELTHYGGISSLVLGVVGAGADAPPPFAAQS